MSVYSIAAVRDYAESSGAAYTLLLIIADGVDATYGANRSNSVADLARQAHFHAWNADEKVIANACRRVRRIIGQLIEAGELIVFTGGGRRTNRNEYVIPFLPGEAGYDARECDATDHDCNHYHTSLSVNRELIATETRNRRKQEHYQEHPGAPSEGPQTRKRRASR